MRSPENTSASRSRPAALRLAAAICLVVAAAGIGVALAQIGAAPHRPSLWQAITAGWIFAIGISIGGPAVAGLLRLTHAQWRHPYTRLAETFSLLAPFGLLSLPVLIRARHALEQLSPHPPHHVWNLGAGIEFLALLAAYVAGLLLLWLGLLPDLAQKRDSGGPRWALWLSLGWRGSSTQWRRLLSARSLLNGMTVGASAIAASLFAWQFQMYPVEGWHSSIFAPYLCLTSALSGLAAAALLSLMLDSRAARDSIHTPETREKAGKFMLAFCILSFYFWWCEFLTTWYGAIPSETRVMAARYEGPLMPFLVLVLAAFPIVPLLMLGAKRVRQRPGVLAAAAALILAAVLADRFVNLAPAVVGHDVGQALHILRMAPVDILIALAPASLLMGLSILAALAVPWASEWEIRLARQSEQADRFAGVPVTRVLRHPPIG